jgi:hypothetical protein
LFVITIGCGEGLRDRALSQEEGKEIQVRFVGVGGCLRVWNKRGRSTSAERQDISEIMT